MENRYPGKCSNCGLNVPAGAGKIEKRNGTWTVYHDGPCPDITSGLGIGGAGSDDYNIHTERDCGSSATGNRGRHHRVQLWEECPRCGIEPVGDCGYCERHCRC